eukprot:1145703-Pelagomonas_calceolata.AAC.1
MAWEGSAKLMIFLHPLHLRAHGFPGSSTAMMSWVGWLSLASSSSGLHYVSTSPPQPVLLPIWVHIT